MWRLRIQMRKLMFHNKDLEYRAKKENGVVTIKQAKKHIEQLPKLNKNYNLIIYIFVVPL